MDAFLLAREEGALEVVVLVESAFGTTSVRRGT